MSNRIAFVGAGSMAEALISGMLTKKLLEQNQITATNRSNYERLQYLQQKYGINITKEKKELIENAEIVILAMKPKDVIDGLEQIAPYITEDHLLISVLAGVSTTTIEQYLQKRVPVVRAMPNTSAAIGKSATAIALGKFATITHLELTRKLFETVGIVTVVDEKDLHAVTGLSGSGPAYVYYLAEAFEKAADEIGLDKETAQTLIVQTLIGAAEMIKSTGKHPSLLRKEVTSPGGTTEAGISVLEKYRFQEGMVSCIKQATERSNELGAILTNLVSAGRST
jgi:pyrroline-5-carboxylate reductase